MSSKSDSETLESIDLVHRAQAGELTAFERLFERYYLRVQTIVRARLGPKLRGELESGDVLNEAMIDAIRSFRSFEVRDQASFIHWLAQIVENCIRKADRHARAVKRDRSRERALEHMLGSLSSGSLCFDPSADGPAPSEEVAGREEVAELEACLDSIEPSHREVILLRNYAGASWDQVANLMERPSPDAARMLYGRALLELRRRMNRSE